MKRTQRGVAAVEFALVLPTFLILLAVMVTLGRAYWAEYIMLDITSFAVRSCVLQQLPVATSSTSSSNSGPALVACATNALSQRLGNFTNICGSGNPTIITPDTVDVPGGSVLTAPGNHIQMLRASVTCKIPAFFVPSLPSIPLVATSAMPFIN